MVAHDYDVGDRVYVIDPGFGNDVVHEGTVSGGSHGEIDVQFPSDPYDPDDGWSRTLSVVPEQVLHVDADVVETYELLGLEDLIEPEDRSGNDAR